MVYVVCLALFVILGSWLVSIYSKFNHLYSRVQSSWQQWVEATETRNARLADFTRVFSAELPSGALLPRDLRRLADDSARALQSVSNLQEQGGLRLLSESEKRLRHAMASSVHTLENNSLMRDDRRLMSLCSEMSVSLVQQEQFAGFYNRHAGLYNEALNSPGGKLFGSMLGFSPVGRI